MRFANCLALAVVMTFLGTAKAQRAEKLPILAKHNATVEKAKAPKLKNQGFVATEKKWKAVWKKLAPKAKAPKVDFSKQFVLVIVRDAADPNRMGVTIQKNNDGVVSILAFSTLIGFEPSTMNKYQFYVVSREGVKGVRRYDRKLRKQVVDPLPK